MPRGEKYREEFRRGLKEARDAIPVLQERWPAAFPKRASLVRPLASRLHVPIAEATGWSAAYAHAVLKRWKLRDNYCRAVLRHDRRYDLNGMATDETVDEPARTQARMRLTSNREARARRHAEILAEAA